MIAVQGNYHKTTIEKRINNSSYFGSELSPRMSTSTSMPSLVPDNLADPIIKIKNNIANKSKISKLYRDVDTGSSDDIDSI